MAGSDSRFDASAFRDAIHFAMEMGRPDITNEYGEFRWKTERTFSAGADSSGSPLDWSASPTTEQELDPVTVPVALEFVSKGGDTQDTRLGQFDVSRCIVTLMDEDYDALLVYDSVLPTQVVFDEAIYDIQFWAPPMALFDVNIYQAHCQAVDEA